MIHGTYNFYLVALSLLVAILASYTAVDLAARICLLEVWGPRRFRWLLCGALAMGTGVWSMHFIGMLAFNMPIRLGYDIAIAASSLLIAILFSLFALYMVTDQVLSPQRLAWGGIWMGLAMAGMHYTGMASLKMHPALHYRPSLVAASIVIAIGASWIALKMASSLRGNETKHLLLKRMGAGLILGIAISGMHYIAMQATMFQLGSHSEAIHRSYGNWLAGAVAGATLFLLAGTLLFSMLGQRFDLMSVKFQASLADANQQLVTLTTKDALTQLPNRSSLMERIGEAIARSLHSDEHFTVLSMDLDGFKTINDTRGHFIGDQLLQEFGQILLRCTRSGDTVARLSGDEFVVLLDGVDQPQDISVVACKIMKALQQELFFDGTAVRMTASIGAASYPKDGSSADELLKHSDMAMLHAKRSGKNTYRFFDAAMSAAAQRALLIHNGLTSAMEKREISLYFQPKFGGTRHELLGAEALVRWHHPDMADIPTLDFIRIAEQSGQIIPFGNWVISEVCQQIRRWDDLGLLPIKIAINLSVEQLQQSNYVDQVREMLQAAGILPTRILFEITETAAMRDAESTAKAVQQFQRAGFDIAIDDFGTGYSSLAYLQRFRVHQVKIDRFFVAGLDSHGEEGLAIVSAIIALAHSLKMVVVAEGVETRTQLAKLRSLECDEVQGYLLARPLSAHQFTEFLCEHSKPALSTSA